MLEIGHIVATISVIWTIFSWKSEIDTATAVNAAEIKMLSERVSQIEDAQARDVSEIRDSLRRIEDKLDRKADKP